MPRSSTNRLISIVVLVAVLGAAAAGIWYLFLRPSGPAPVGQASPPASAPAASADPSTGASADPTTSGSGAPSTGLDGTWTVDPSIGSFDDFSGSWVGYRVQEELAGIGGQEAVGRTPDVSGTLTLDGQTVSEVTMTADLSTLQSDDDRRDGQLRRQALETQQFPEATFKLTSPIDLGGVPAEGQPISASATGDLTLHGQTKSVTIPISATLSGSTVTVTGSIDIPFSDFGIEKPSSFVVLSVEDHGVMEFQLQFAKG